MNKVRVLRKFTYIMDEVNEQVRCSSFPTGEGESKHGERGIKREAEMREKKKRD